MCALYIYIYLLLHNYTHHCDNHLYRTIGRNSMSEKRALHKQCSCTRSCRALPAHVPFFGPFSEQPIFREICQNSIYSMSMSEHEHLIFYTFIILNPIFGTYSNVHAFIHVCMYAYNIYIYIHIHIYIYIYNI